MMVVVRTNEKREKKKCTNLHKHRAHTSFWLRNYSINGQNGKLCIAQSSLPFVARLSLSINSSRTWCNDYFFFFASFFVQSKKQRPRSIPNARDRLKFLFWSEFTTQLSCCISLAHLPQHVLPSMEWSEQWFFFPSLRLQFRRCFHIDGRVLWPGTLAFQPNMNEKCSLRMRRHLSLNCHVSAVCG